MDRLELVNLRTAEALESSKLARCPTIVTLGTLVQYRGVPIVEVASTSTTVEKQEYLDG